MGYHEVMITYSNGQTIYNIMKGTKDSILDYLFNQEKGIDKAIKVEFIND